MPPFSSHLRGFPVPPHLLFVPLCILFSALCTSNKLVRCSIRTKPVFQHEPQIQHSCLHVSVVSVVARRDEKNLVAFSRV